MTGEHLAAVADILRRQEEAYRVLCTAQSQLRAPARENEYERFNCVHQA
jgi:hypothetical protein